MNLIIGSLEFYTIRMENKLSNNIQKVGLEVTPTCPAYI